MLVCEEVMGGNEQRPLRGGAGRWGGTSEAVNTAPPCDTYHVERGI